MLSATILLHYQGVWAMTAMVLADMCFAQNQSGLPWCTSPDLYQERTNINALNHPNANFKFFILRYYWQFLFYSLLYTFCQTLNKVIEFQTEIKRKAEIVNEKCEITILFLPS